MNFNASNYHVIPTEITKGFVKLQKYNNLDASVFDICEGFVYNYYLSSANYESCSRRFVTAYNSLKKDKDLHIIKADKSNALVIIDKHNNVNKMKELLADNNVYSKLHKNPLVNVNSNYNRKNERIFSFSKELKQKFKPFTPRLPHMYGLIKTH